MTKIYSIRYCFTTGIEELEGKIDLEVFYYKSKDVYSILGLRSLQKDEYFLTYEEAATAAHKKRVRKIKSLNRRIEKLENLIF